MNFRQWWLLVRLGSAALKAGLHHQIDSQKLETARAEFCLKVLRKIWGGKNPGRGKRLRQQLENLGTTYISSDNFYRPEGICYQLISSVNYLSYRTESLQWLV